MLYGAIRMTSQYPMHCVLRKTLGTTSSVSESGDMDSEKPQCGDPEHRIIQCGIISIKTDTCSIDGYMINVRTLRLSR